MKKCGLLEAKGVSLEKNGKQILNDANFSVPCGRITTFIGESGAGKSSILRVLSQLEKEYSGNVFLDGVDIKQLSNAKRAKEVGFLFQDFNLFAGMTAKENATHPLKVVFGFDSASAKKRADEVFAELGIEPIADKYPSQLSGGQKQRVALARLLATDPEIILFDEPTSALDPSNCIIVSNILKQLAEKGVGIGVASHDPVLLQRVLDRVYKIRDGQMIEHYDSQTDKIEDRPLIAKFLAQKDA